MPQSGATMLRLSQFFEFNYLRKFCFSVGLRHVQAEKELQFLWLSPSD
jgi:hypothetical protein